MEGDFGHPLRNSSTTKKKREKEKRDKLKNPSKGKCTVHGERRRIRGGLKGGEEGVTSGRADLVKWKKLERANLMRKES